MDIHLESLDWSWVRSFFAVAELGSLSAAGRKLNQSQPTIGRHIKSIEKSLGVELFQRTPTGLTLTTSGHEILQYARQMSEAANRLRMVAEGQADDLRGTVRITASMAMSHFVLPGIISDIRNELPEIRIELVPTDKTENLIFREADIAIRMYRPTQPEVISRHVTDYQIGLYASRKYLDRDDRRDRLNDLLSLDFIGLDKETLMIRTMGDLGIDVDRDFFPVRCDDQSAGWHLVRAGCGVGAILRLIGDTDPLVELIPTGFDIPDLPVWLAAPDALRSNARIRRVWDILVKALANPPDA